MSGKRSTSSSHVPRGGGGGGRRTQTVLWGRWSAAFKTRGASLTRRASTGEAEPRRSVRATKGQHTKSFDELEPAAPKRRQTKKSKKALEAKIGVIDELDRARSGPVRVLSELAARTPERLWLTSLVTEGKTILMSGQSLDNDLVALFLRSLGESAYFTDVDLDKTEMRESGGLRLMNFRIRAELANPDPNTLAEAA